MLRCKASYSELCAVSDLKLVGNSLVAWPAALKNCKRIPHPQRETKEFMRDQILCRESSRHVGNVQNNMAIGVYKGKHVALFRATDTVIDCGQGTIIDFPSWKAMREMLASSKPEVPLTVTMLLALAGEAEDEVAAGFAEEVKVEPAVEPLPAPLTPPDADVGNVKKRSSPESDDPEARGVQAESTPAFKKAKLSKPLVDANAWLTTELSEYPNNIRLVSSESSENYAKLIEEASSASCVGYDCQWSPDFNGETDHPIALLQLGFPISGNTYVLQLPLLDEGFPDQVRHLFESPKIAVAGFCANEMDFHKFEITGVQIDRPSVYDVQPWSEAEMGENESVKQGWRVGLKRAAACVLDFEMDKAPTVATSNWERVELTPAQVEHGALNVWVALRLYQCLAPVYKQ